MAEIRFHDLAATELREAFDWYEDKNSEVAERFADAVDAAIDRIAQHPRRWPLKDDCHRICRVIGFPYAIIYREAGEVIVILAVAHSRRSDDYWKGRNGGSSPSADIDEE